MDTIRIIFKQIFNRRRANAWLLGSLFVVGVVLWFCVDILYNYTAASLQPIGYDTDHVYSVKLKLLQSENPDIFTEGFEAVEKNIIRPTEEIRRRINEYPGVECSAIQFGTSAYNGSTNTTMFQGYTIDSVRAVGATVRYFSPEYFDVMKIPLIKGKIDAKQWHYTVSPLPTVISEDFADSLFHSTDVVGREYMDYYTGVHQKVMAVCARQKFDEYGAYHPFCLLPLAEWYYKVITIPSFVVRVRPEADDAHFAERFMAECGSKLKVGAFCVFEVQSFKDIRAIADFANGSTQRQKSAWLVLSFFIFNVFLGLLGTFWFRTNQRRAEIGLQMALGSSKADVRNRLIGEGLLLLSLAFVASFIVNLNFYQAGLMFSSLVEANAVRFIIGQLITYLLMALMVVLGIWIPARRAMRIAPAEALHNE